MTRGIRTALALAVALGSTSLLAQDEPDKGRGEKVDGYAEFRLGGCIVADAQRVCPAPGLKFKGEGEAKDFGSVPLGYELKAKGTRRADGTLLAREVEAKPNGSALFEGEIKSATDQAEAQAREKGRFVGGRRQEGDERRQAHRAGAAGRPRPPHRGHPAPAVPAPGGRAHLRDREQGVERLRHGQLLHLRLHGAPRRHGRRRGGDRARPRARARDPRALAQAVQAGHVGPARSRSARSARPARSTTTRSGGRRARRRSPAPAYRTATGAGWRTRPTAWACATPTRPGYDITKGPRLWNRFAKKYGEGNKVANFFFSDHSQSAARATKLEKEIAYNYPDGPKPDGPARQARRAGRRRGPCTVAAPPAGVPAGAQALAAAPPPPVSSAAPAGQTDGDQGGHDGGRGAPAPRRPAGRDRLRREDAWTYPALTVVFVGGKVTDVKF